MSKGTIWDNTTALDTMEEQRDKRRIYGNRVTFDCLNARTHTDIANRDRVCCVKGHNLNSKSKDGTIGLYSVLNGIRLSVCQDCADFDCEED